ncbi:ATP-binding protein [Streptacidiphilus rugosus]|uniref:ATP-binding protein n=1 Tax=Streptacidiphilus rugosus TaxID=405783 RepID=UPI00056176F1|nr:LuxR family transcriptional regulator [Streptacidiphilus rugosus]
MTESRELLPTPTGGDIGFVGRQTQLEQLRVCAAGARDGVPWIVAVEGEAGIGKTALVHAAMGQLEDYDVLWASCDPFEQDYPLGVVEQIVRRLPAPLLADTALVKAGALAGTSPAQVGAELVRLLTAAAKTRPVALVVDDVQWADPGSMAALGFVTRRLWAERALILLTARTESEHASGSLIGTESHWQRMISGAEHGLRINVPGLDETQILELARRLGAPALSLWAARRLREHTGGQPLYLRSVITETPVEQLNDEQSLLAAPQSLAAAIRYTLDRLPADSRSLVESLAVLGTTVPLPLAAQVAGVQDSTTALEQALDAGLVQWWPSDPSSPLRIKHHVQQEAIYQTISPSHRQALHAAAASLVDVNASWAHRVAATSTADSTLAAELETEADRVATTGHLARSATLLLWAASLSEARPQHETRLLRAVLRLLLAKDYTRAATRRKDVEACTDSAVRTCVLGGLAYAEGDLRTAERLFTDALNSSEAEGEGARAAALARVWLGATYTRQRRGSQALPLLLRAAELELPAPRAVNYARHVLAVASADIGGPRTHRSALARIDNDPEIHAQAALAASLLLNPRGILREMSNELHAGMADLPTLVRRQRAGEAAAQVQGAEYFVLAAFQYLAGAWDDARTTARNALTVAAAGGQLFGFSAGHAVASMSAAVEGRWDAAQASLRAAERAADQRHLALDAVYPILAAVVLHQAHGEAAAMAAALQRLPAPGDDIQSLGWQVWWLPLQVEAGVGTGRLEEAANALAQLKTLAEDVPCLRLTTCWLAGALYEARRDPGRAETAYREGAALPTDSDEIPLHRARLEHAYGNLLPDSEPDARRLHLERALDRYQAMGAHCFALQIEQQLDEAAPATPPADHAASAPAEPPSPPPAAALPARLEAQLTDRELAVARLVAEGLTNKEVAASLHVSAKTVEYHLGHVYTKLDLTSRRQLRAAVRKPDEGQE